MNAMLVYVPICIECTRVFIFIKSSTRHRLCCSARAHSPRKHQQNLNPRDAMRYDDIVIIVATNDNQRFCFRLHLTVYMYKWVKICIHTNRRRSRCHNSKPCAVCRVPCAIVNGTYSRPSVNRISCTLIVLYSSIQHIFRFLRQPHIICRGHNLISTNHLLFMEFIFLCVAIIFWIQANCNNTYTPTHSEREREMRLFPSWTHHNGVVERLNYDLERWENQNKM